MKRLFALNALTLCLSLAVVESIGQLYYRWTDGAFLPQLHRQHQRDVESQAAVFERHPYLVARPRSGVVAEREGVLVSTTSIHTRVTGASGRKPGRTTVAVLGGSTTFGTRVKDSDTWPWLLQEKLGDDYSIVNYGVPGYTTAEAIIQMALLVPDEKPAVVIFYLGWNDLRNYHWPGLTADYYSHGISQFDTLIPAAADRKTLWTKATRYSFVIGLLSRSLGTAVEARAQSGAAAAPSDRNDPEVDRIYRRNLGTLKVLAGHFGMTALFVPQVLNSENYSLRGVSRRWTPHIEDAAVPALMQDFNRIMSEVCVSAERRCQFVGEALTEQWNGDDFVDEGHFTRRGGEKLAAVLAGRIRLLE